MPVRHLAAMAMVVMLAVGPATSGVSAAEATAISERELAQLFPGTFQVVVRGIIKIHIVANGDGSLSGQNQKANDSDSGHWSIRAGKLCIQFSKWLKSELRCAVVIDDGDWYRTADVAFKKADGVALTSQ
jgi:hypothetical protein